MFEKKKLAKRRAEEEKEARKRKRIEAKEKDKLMPAMTTVKRKLFTKTGVDSSCPAVIKLSHLNLGYVAMIETKSSMKNLFQNSIRSTLPFLKMVMNSSVTCVTK
jgi:hypothetical protein